jgi:hypothetical protein
MDTFDLLIEEWPPGFRARYRDPETGKEFCTTFSLPLLKEDSEGILAPGMDCRDATGNRAVSRDEPSAIGSCLFKAVFADEILVAWNLRLQKARTAGLGLRLRLQLQDPVLWDRPWEFLKPPDGAFLATQPLTPVVRFLPGTGVISSPRVRPPIRVLVVTAHPKECAPLASPAELDKVEKALVALDGAGWVDLELLEHATRKSLRARLQQGIFHIIHFIGHGSFDPGRGGAILLEDEEGRSDPVGSHELSVPLTEHPEIRLVVLNACHGARRTDADPFSGITQGLIQAGVPAVVAMQATVTDDAAISFSEDFYHALAKRKDLDQAVCDARVAMVNEGFTREWGVPVLATSSRDLSFLSPTWGQRASDLLERILHHSKVLWALLILVALVGAWFQFYGARWYDPNWLSKAQNPSDCPTPKGLSIAFVKVEPPSKPAFCMARYETTQHLWNKLGRKVRLRRKGAGLPMVRVSWDDAEGFIDKLNRRDPRGHYRLPTAEEWEYAAKGGEENPPVASSATANCRNQEDPDGFENTAPVGSFQPNRLGLYDMFGNASEWASNSLYPDRKIRLGGGFKNVLENCSVDYPSALDPGTKAEDAGFRIVREPVEP